MRWMGLGGVLAVMLAAAGGLEAATPENFQVRTTSDLIALCSVSKDDPLWRESIHFCHGFLVGAYQFQEALYSGPKEKPLVCPKEPRPSRDEAVQHFVIWVREHPSTRGSARSIP